MENEIEKKDITDILISDETQQIEDETQLEDHPGLAIIDIALNQAQEYCRKNNIPEPNIFIYQNFSRSFLNKALWHYFPSGNLPDDPRIALVLGITGLGFACLPTILHILKRRKHEEVKEVKKEEVREAEIKPESKTESKILEKIQSRLNEISK